MSQYARNLIAKLLVLDPSKRLSFSEILTHPFMTSSKIPKQLQSSVTCQAPNRSFLDQHGGTAPQYSSSKYVSGKSETRVESEIDRVKSEKGISERLLCTQLVTQ